MSFNIYDGEKVPSVWVVLRMTRWGEKKVASSAENSSAAGRTRTSLVRTEGKTIVACEGSKVG